MNITDYPVGADNSSAPFNEETITITINSSFSSDLTINISKDTIIEDLDLKEEVEKILKEKLGKEFRDIDVEYVEQLT